MRERLVVRRRRPVSKGAASTPCSEGDVFTELMVDQVPPPAESDPGRRRLSSADPEPGVARHQFPPLDQPPPDDWASRQGTRSLGDSIATKGAVRDGPRKIMDTHA
ncbi:hypothetical protein FJT64_020742 [Amphibalanus amphitrite]|uniref:Uncharacterized protein n=1 Tax=Amphibalanus amphitrite TaxID=1232801 RepID=A0A6A4WZQ2_AMPAM|nr:hypothetical protein FJT64_020742 [Amphibalanus amphitrite]